VLDGVEHGMVLGSGAHCEPTVAGHGTHHGRVVGLGAPAGEHHVTSVAADHCGHHIAGVVEGGAGGAGEAVRPRGVGELLVEERQHRLDRLATHRRAGRMVEVDELAGHGNHATGGR
jgi:hypothetical protein